ncbi:hypothetical protein B0J11DRAFT_568798 [Dendryphion nanum]|uniref:Uncharacterized protein n=1 Tax=Dendryphion nanum TaxID=256645 RepID=A0A9P9IIZ0_9PLEO|nr:hypothetical protein B0J11DRAFT_568798 [Dendryphion nanum]
MPITFLSLPSEVRNDIYGRLLLRQQYIACPTQSVFRRFQPRELTPGLLRVNKMIHGEASSLLYAQNHFNLTMCTSEDVTSFFKQIGYKNANYIRHIYIKFPRFRYLDMEDVTIEDDSLRILEIIRDHCHKLSTITTSLSSTNDMELRLDALDHLKIVGKAMALVDTCFRAISSLEEIIAEVYEDGPSGHIRREMKRLGWKNNEIEYVEESISDGSDYSFNEDDIDGQLLHFTYILNLQRFLMDGGRFEGHEHLVTLLLKEDADPNFLGRRYSNALQAASSGGHELVIKRLLGARGDPDAPGGYHSKHSR